MPAGPRREVVVEPTAPAWLPIAVFFARRGHVVHRVSSAKASDLRRFFSRHAKTNGIDADTLARLPLVDPTGLQALVLPGAEQAALDRRGAGGGPARPGPPAGQAGADRHPRPPAPTAPPSRRPRRRPAASSLPPP